MSNENAFVEIAKVVGDVLKNAPAAIVGKILPVDKLIDTLARGIGLLYHPRHIKNTAAATAERLIAETNAAELAKDMKQRAKFRREVEALHHQTNLESIAAKAEKYLPPEVSPDPVDPGWTHCFAEKAQNATRDDLQELWAKVLAGEVSKPGSVSTRTLSILEDMSAADAGRFLKVACASAEYGLVLGSKDNAIIEIGLATHDLSELVKRGLLHEPLSSDWQVPSGTELRYFNQRWTFSNADEGVVRVPCAMLTDAAIEMLCVTDRQAIPSFANIIEAIIKKSSPRSSISVATEG